MQARKRKAVRKLARDNKNLLKLDNDFAQFV